MELLWVSPIEGIGFIHLGPGGIGLLWALVCGVGEAIDGMGEGDEGILIVRERIRVIGIIWVAVSMAGEVESGGRWSRVKDIAIIVIFLRQLLDASGGSLGSLAA
jgi:hypothetical protein